MNNIDYDKEYDEVTFGFERGLIYSALGTIKELTKKTYYDYGYYVNIPFQKKLLIEEVIIHNLFFENTITNTNRMKVFL